tara:strand:- start:473 stop:1072 length:600 start_codon:yes stop_codon:yes gene_type:complete
VITVNFDLPFPDRIRTYGQVAFSVAVLVIAAAGCVESRPRYTPVPAIPTSTSTPIPKTPIPTATPTATPLLPSPTPFPTATSVPTPVIMAPTVGPTQIPTVAVSTAVSSGTFNLALDFEGLNDESIVWSETVLLRGVTSADAIVSVNDIIVEVQANGTFELTLTLDPGPNFVDVVASDLEGSQINSSLAIISIPPEQTP